MEINFFLKGVILGFSIAAPVGPIGILCIRRTLQFGRFSGLLSGLGAATADGMYAIIAAFGLTFIPCAVKPAPLGVGYKALINLCWNCHSIFSFFSKT